MNEAREQKVVAIARAQDVQAWTPEQRDLIKRTVAPQASDDELAMFLHIAAVSGLDPLRKQIHFMKHSGRVVIVADVNGLQARAAREADFEGLLHAVVYEKDDFQVDNATGSVLRHTTNPLGSNGKILGAWATVKRKGKLPFTSVVRFGEYDNANNALWKSKPAVMIDKVAKSTALRLAYPEQLGGIYDRAELDKTDEREVNPAPAPVVAAEPTPELAQLPVTGRKTAQVKQQLAARVVRSQVVDVSPGETEEQAEARAAAPEVPAVTPWTRAKAMLEAAGLTGSIAGGFMKTATGCAAPKDVTDADVLKLEAALAARQTEAF